MIETSREVERIFINEVRDKKRTGSGIFSKTGSRGYVGKMLLPTDLMSRKEKYNHRKAGKVESYNMYETILPRHEFLKKDIETQKMLLMRWREIYPNNKIMKEMGFSGAGTFQKLITDLDIPKKVNRIAKPRGTYKKQEQEKTEKVIESNDIQETVRQEPAKLLIDGLHLEYNGVFNAEQLNKIFTKLQLLTDSEENNFYLSISLTEKA